MITSGNTEIKSIYYNGKTIKKVFSCGNYVWSGDTPTPISVTGVSLTPITASVEVGSAITLTATVLPSNATDKTVTWTTSDSSIATVANGVVTAVASGDCTITVTTTDGGYTASCAVNVTSPTPPTPPTPYDDRYLTFVAEDNSGMFKFTNAVNYSLDSGSTWTSLNANSWTPLIASGASIMFKATLSPRSTSGVGTFSSSGRFSAEGNPMSLLFGDNFSGQTSLSGKRNAFKEMFNGCTLLTSAEHLSLLATTLTFYCYESMFEGCTSLTTAPELLATTLERSCYESMFSGCTSLTTAPELPAIGLADYCYNGMFVGCTSLTTAPALPAIGLANGCYNAMFWGCTSLTTAPSLPAIGLADYCYRGMFEGCTSLTTAPTLSATTLANGCYLGMFSGCTSLTTAPELPATTLAEECYQNMFSNCTSLTTAPELLATTLERSCYLDIFTGCTSLNYIKCMASDITASYCTRGWVIGVAATGTFVKASGVDWGSCGTSNIPCGWTVEEV